MKPEAAMIFAAGFGTRMGALTKTQPKPMVPVAGRPMIDHGVDLLQAAGPLEIVVNTHYFADQIEDHFADRPHIHCVREAPLILDTGGGLRNALPVLGSDPVLTFNPDALWLGQNPVQTILDAWQPEKMDGLMAMVSIERTLAYHGVGDFFLDPDQRLIRRGASSRAPYVFGGLSILKTGHLHQINEEVFGLSKLWDRMLADQRLFGLKIDTDWIDMGHPEGVDAADRWLTARHNV